MTGRDEIFGRLKATLDRVHNPTVRVSGADQRIRDAAPVLVPERGRAEGPAKTAMFVAEAQTAQAEVRRLARPGDVPGVVGEILKASGIDKLKTAPHQTLQAMNWSGVDISFGRGAGEDRAGLSVAFAAVAETGTVVMASSPATPTTLNFLPDVHMVVVREEDLAANYEQVWARLREDAEPDAPMMPRTVNWITGPSRTADIEQTILLGAHGPRKLIILLIDAQTA